MLRGNVLAVDTSSRILSIALRAGEDALFEANLENRFVCSKRLIASSNILNGAQPIVLSDFRSFSDQQGSIVFRANDHSSGSPGTVYRIYMIVKFYSVSGRAVKGLALKATGHYGTRD